LLERAAQDPRFEGDPYLRAHDPASVMVVPLLHQGRALGAMYLEHPHVTGVFTEERLRVVHLLGAQAATAVENATLYAELLSTNERLERQVEERTVELRAAKRLAEEASRAKSDFLASMSHELRTPLNSVLGYSQLLERSAGLSADDRARAQVIHRSGEHLLTLIDDVLDLAKIEAGKLEFAPRSVNLPVLLRTVVDMCRVRAEQKGLALGSELVGRAPESLRVDDKRLMQVLLNLLTNAIKFTAQGSVRLHVAIAPAPPSDDGAPPAHDLCMRVEDTGRGMNAEQMARVFEAFEQAGDAQSRAEGAGLGLAISRRIVEHMGGHIAVQSELGRGSVFTVSLRLPEAGALAGGRDAGSWAEISGYEGERRLILVVDDHENNCTLARDLLAPLGFAVELAASGEEALARAAERRPALVVMDLSMPGMDGYETLARLRGLGEPQPIALAWSASVLGAVEQRIRSAGFDDFVPKPVAPAVLLDAIGRCLGLSWVHRAARPSAEAAALPQAPRIVPPPDVVAVLREHASLGRLRDVQREAARLGQEHPEFLPWLTEVQDLARRFQVKPLRELLA
jgi:signal transduction histidine kinase/CheY-like chemotaxis protein